MITLRNITLERGAKVLFQNVNLAFFARQKIGIVGRNGVGKTSLLNLILGELTASAGTITISGNSRFSYISQDIPNSEENCLNFVVNSDAKLTAVREKLLLAEKNNAGREIAFLHLEYENLGGYSAHARAAELLTGLGFSQKQLYTAVNSLSGGWRMLLNLAKTLFVPAEILLLDEPTNHLDLDALIWLEDFIQKYTGLLLIISHDRDFLDNITTHIAHIEQQNIKLYSGNYSNFENQYALNQEVQEKTFHKQLAQTEHWQKFIERFRYKASKAKQVQSRIKAMQRIQVSPPCDSEGDLSFKFLAPRIIPQSLVTLEKVDFSYGANVILENINLKVMRDMRIGLLGANGAGKSTLIKLIANQLVPARGQIAYNPHLCIGYFAQHQLDQLNLTETAFTHLEKLNIERVSPKGIRAFLGGFGFSGEKALQKVATYSGGEKARLALALLVWQKPNLLLLDEPTNHLDFSMRQTLIMALQEFSGALIVVSHDRFLLRSTVDEFVLVANKEVKTFEGDLLDYQNLLLIKTSEKSSGQQKIAVKQNIKRSCHKNLISQLEKKLGQLQIELEDINAKLADQAFYHPNRAGELTKITYKFKQLDCEIKQTEEQLLEFWEAN